MKQQSNENEVMEKIGSAQLRKYLLAENNNIDSSISAIKRIEVSGKEDQFYALEKNTSVLKLYNRELEVVGVMETHRLSVYEEKGFIIDFAYDEVGDIICFITNDQKVYFYEGSGKMTLLHIAEKFKRTFTGVWYLKKANLWAAASTDHWIVVWRVYKTGLIFLNVVSRSPSKKESSRRTASTSTTSWRSPTRTTWPPARSTAV
jgi:hypothetical protein